MEDFRRLKLKLFIGIAVTVLIAVFLGPRFAAGTYLLVVFGTLLALYFKARSQAHDPSFRLDIAGRSLLAVGNIALGMGLVLMGILAFRELGDLADKPGEMWHALGFIVAPLLEGAATSTIASFLWDDLQAYGATLHPTPAAASSTSSASPPPHTGVNAPGPATTCAARGLSTDDLQQQVDALKKALGEVGGAATNAQKELKALALDLAKQKTEMHESFKKAVEANNEQVTATTRLLNSIRDMLSDYQAFLTRPNT